jgi:hypothetical protein
MKICCIRDGKKVVEYSCEFRTSVRLTVYLGAEWTALNHVSADKSVASCRHVTSISLLTGNVRRKRRHNSLAHYRWLGLRSNKNICSGHVLMWKLKKIFHDIICTYMILMPWTQQSLLILYYVTTCSYPLSVIFRCSLLKYTELCKTAAHRGSKHVVT